DLLANLPVWFTAVVRLDEAAKLLVSCLEATVGIFVELPLLLLNRLHPLDQLTSTMQWKVNLRNHQVVRKCLPARDVIHTVDIRIKGAGALTIELLLRHQHRKAPPERLPAGQ